MSNNQEVHNDWIVGVKGRLHQVYEQLNQSRMLLFEIAVCTGVGFLSGFLIKRYASSLAWLIALGIIVIVLQHYGIVIVNVNWQKIYQLLDISSNNLPTNDSLLTFLWEWGKNNSIIVLSYIVGFGIGLKLG